MKNQVSIYLLSELNQFLANHIGLDFSKNRWPDLQRGVSLAARELGIDDLTRFVQELLASPIPGEHIAVLSRYLTVGETYFFRDKKSFEVLEQHVFPELIRLHQDGERRLRIWSAGCCTGEEPYSLAMLLHGMIPDLSQWQLTILGTDINTDFLRKATTGIYGTWSFRSTPKTMKTRFFNKEAEGRFRIDHRLTEMISFSYLNLVDDVYPSLLNNTNAMDIILCRNVLMYLVPEQIKKVVDKLYRSLAEGGWLIVSATETFPNLFTDFATVNFPGAIFYKKDKTQIKHTPIVVASALPPVFSAPLTIEKPPTIATQAQPPMVQAVPIPEPKTDQETTAYDEALVLYQNGNYNEAAEKLLQCNKTEPAVNALLSKVFANQGQLSEAFEYVQKAISADKLNPVYQYLKAAILNEQGLTAESAQSLQRALYLDPGFVMAHFSLGNLSLKQGKRKEAVKHFKNCIALLQSYDQKEIVPESEGLAVGRLSNVIASMSNLEVLK